MRKQASQLDVLSIKRKISSINANIDSGDATVISEINSTITEGFAGAEKATSVAQVDFFPYNVNSSDYGGLAGTGGWKSPYVASEWYSTVDVLGRGEVNYISFASTRGVFVGTASLSKIKCTIDGVEVFLKETTFTTQDAATAREYVVLGTIIGLNRIIQNKLYFSKSLLIEVYSDYLTQPKPVPFINYQLY